MKGGEGGRGSEREGGREGGQEGGRREGRREGGSKGGSNVEVKKWHLKNDKGPLTTELK